MTLRAKLTHDSSYIIVPFLEGDEKTPWRKKSFEDVSEAIKNATV